MKKNHWFCCLTVIVLMTASALLAQEPTVQITSPVDGTRLDRCSDLHAVADAQAPDGVKLVTFFINGAPQNNDTQSPYEMNFTNAPEGYYDLTARLIDKKNKTVFSDKITVIVGNPEPGNLMINSEFLCKTWPWELALNGIAKAKVVLDPEAWIADSTAGLVTIQSIGPNSYDVQLQQILPIDSGHTYLISFVGSSEKPKDIQVGIQMASSPFTGYFWQSASLIDQPTTFGPFEFISSGTNALTYLRFQIGGDTTRMWLDQVMVVDQSKVVAVDEKKSSGRETGGVSYILCQNYPNPFNSYTTFQYRLPENADVMLDLYNLKGQKVRTLIQERQKPGEHLTQWNGTDETGAVVPSGVYFYYLKAKAGDKTYTYSSKILLLE
jgi:hypothetical protein